MVSADRPQSCTTDMTQESSMLATATMMKNAGNVTDTLVMPRKKAPSKRSARK